MKNCNSRIPKILVLLFSVMFLFFSCSDIFSTREETGSVTFSLSPELIKAVANACRAADDEGPIIAPGPESQEESEQQDLYRFEIALKGDYRDSQSKSGKDKEEFEEKLKAEVFRFENIPVGKEIYAEAKIIYGQGHLQWAIMIGKSDSKRIEAGENNLTFNLHQAARCNIYNNTDTTETLSDIERISVYALPQNSAQAKEILELVAEDTDLNDFVIKSKLESYKELLIGDYYASDSKESESGLSPYFCDGYDLKAGEKYYFLTLVYIKNGPVYLGHPQFEGTDPELAKKALTTISLDETNMVYLSLMELELDIDEVEIHFLFWDDKQEKYIESEDEDFQPKTMKNDGDFDKEFDEWAIKALHLGYEINERKSGEVEYDKENDKYVVYVYFDKAEITNVFTATGTPSDTTKYNSSFVLTATSDLNYVINYTIGSGDTIVVSKGTWITNSEDKFSITETEYFDFVNAEDMSPENYKMTKAKSPAAQTIDISSASFNFTSAGGPVITFVISHIPSGPMPFEIAITPASGTDKSKLHSVVIYALDSSTAATIKGTIGSSATAAIKLSQLLEQSTDKQVTYLQIYDPRYDSDSLSLASDGTINISDSYTTWGVMGAGKSAAILALLNYGDGSDISSYCAACSSVFEVSSTKNTVALKAESMDIPCNVYFYLNDELSDDYTIRTSFTSFNPSSDSKTFVSSVMSNVSTPITKITKEGYTYSKYSYGQTNGIPYVDLYFTKSEAYATALTLDPESATVKVGESATFTATLEYSDGSSSLVKDVVAKGSDSEIATVSTNSDGEITVTGLKAGELEVTVTAEGQKATCKVTVEAVSTTSGISVTLEETDTTDKGEYVTLKSEKTSDGLSFTAEINDEVKDNVTVTSYTWIVEGLTPEDGNDGSYAYFIPASKYEELSTGWHQVTCVVVIDGEYYSAKTSFTVTSDVQ